MISAATSRECSTQAPIAATGPASTVPATTAVSKVKVASKPAATSATAPIVRRRHYDDDSGGEIAESGEGGGSIASQTSQPKTTQTTPAPTPAPAPTPTPAPAPVGKFKDGTYTGSVASAYYGNVQTQAVIQGGALTDVNILQSPSDQGTSRYIASMSLPTLKSEAIQSQSANVDAVSGATYTSAAFVQSLGAALAQAAN